MFENRPLYYMAPVTCAPWIVLYGILSYNRVRQPHPIRPDTQSIADPFVNDRRDRLTINGTSLHDYVPLYWATHTPMQYVVTIKEKRLKEPDLIFFILDSDTVLSLPGVLTTDGNAASDKTGFWVGNGALPSIDWNIVKTDNCYSRLYKQKKCAEVLVPDEIPPALIKRICVMSVEAQTKLHAEVSRVARIAHQHKLFMRSMEPEIAPELYYPQYALIDEMLAQLKNLSL